MHGIIKIIGFVVAVAVVVGGCSRSAAVLDDRGTVMSPTLQTNLYGQLDPWQSVEFSARPMASLIQHSFCQEGGDFDPDISTDGTWMVFSSLRHAPNPDLYIKRIDGATATRLTSDPASEIQPCFSPDAAKVAYASNRSGSWDIWVVGVDGSNPVRITTDNANAMHPSFSPDGKRLVYCAYGSKSGQWELWIVHLDNPAVKQWIGYGVFPQWCPNADVPKIAFQLPRYRGDRWFSIWTIDLVDDEARYPTEIISSVHHACICPAWMADGSKLLYSTVGNAADRADTDSDIPSTVGQDVWMVDLDGRNNVRLTSGDSGNYSPAWAPDGRVFYCSDRTGVDNVWSTMPQRMDFQQARTVDLSKHPQAALSAN